MRRSRLKPKKTTYIQRQKTHPISKNKFSVCINCGTFTTNFEYLPNNKDRNYSALERAMIMRYGTPYITENGFYLKGLDICGPTCTKKFIATHKLELLEEITK